MISVIEDAIIARIKAVASASPGLGYQLPTVESYGGELDDDLAAVVRKFPAVWVTFAGSGKSRPSSTARNKWITPATFVVMVGARNVRGERATRQGLKVDGVLKEVGVYQMLHDVGLLLINNDLGLPVGNLKPGATRTLFNTKLNGQAMAVFAREWHTEFIETQPREPIDPTDPMWLSLGINYYLKPGDAVADASDLTTLS
jgi:phage gp37-like protein